MSVKCSTDRALIHARLITNTDPLRRSLSLSDSEIESATRITNRKEAQSVLDEVEWRRPGN